MAITLYHRVVIVPSLPRIVMFAHGPDVASTTQFQEIVLGELQLVNLQRSWSKPLRQRIIAVVRDKHGKRSRLPDLRNRLRLRIQPVSGAEQSCEHKHTCAREWDYPWKILSALRNRMSKPNRRRLYPLLVVSTRCHPPIRFGK
jgi:hypothetical protein